MRLPAAGYAAQQYGNVLGPRVPPRRQQQLVEVNGVDQRGLGGALTLGQRLGSRKRGGGLRCRCCGTARGPRRLLRCLNGRGLGVPVAPRIEARLGMRLLRWLLHTTELAVRWLLVDAMLVVWLWLLLRGVSALGCCVRVLRLPVIVAVPLRVCGGGLLIGLPVRLLVQIPLKGSAPVSACWMLLLVLLPSGRVLVLVLIVRLRLCLLRCRGLSGLWLLPVRRDLRHCGLSLAACVKAVLCRIVARSASIGMASAGGRIRYRIIAICNRRRLRTVVDIWLGIGWR